MKMTQLGDAHSKDFPATTEKLEIRRGAERTCRADIVEDFVRANLRIDGFDSGRHGGRRRRRKRAERRIEKGKKEGKREKAD